ncbi:MAG: hypothetical protein LH632_00445 [Rhodoferax sp.]|nr:hypothetical protein [Rhodoferax sp.]
MTSFAASSMQVVVHARLASNARSPKNRRRAQQLVWHWVAAKWPRLMPCSDEIEALHIERALPGQALLVSTSRDGAKWSLSVAHSERNGRRTWTTETSVTDTGSTDLVTLQTACSDIGYTPLVVAPPKVLGAWVEALDLDDGGVAVIGEPRMVNQSAQLDSFCAHVLSGLRTLPVIALTNKTRTHHYGVDPHGLAEAVRGLAHVACLSPEMAAALPARLGLGAGVVHGAARIYGAGFSQDAGGHTLVQDPREPDAAAIDDPGAFRRLLCRQVCHLSVQRRTAQPGPARQ